MQQCYIHQSALQKFKTQIIILLCDFVWYWFPYSADQVQILKTQLPDFCSRVRTAFRNKCGQISNSVAVGSCWRSSSRKSALSSHLTCLIGLYKCQVNGVAVSSRYLAISFWTVDQGMDSSWRAIDFSISTVMYLLVLYAFASIPPCSVVVRPNAS